MIFTLQNSAIMLKKIAVFVFFVSVLLLINTGSFAQRNIKDSTITSSFISFNYSYNVPGGDLKNRFGNNSAVGANFFRKYKNNFVWGIDFSYLFGSDIKETSILDSLRTERGFIINRNGQYANVRLYERGFNTTFKIGKVIPAFGPNKNSGFLVTAGAGFMQHKIRIEDIGNSTPALNNDYKKGYDRLSNGLSLTEFIGYLYLDNKRLLNFYAGVEFTQAFTQNRRDYNFDTMTRDSQKRLDLLSGIKFGFVIPLYRRAPKEFYFN
jgi:hypothetical protein